MKKLAKAIVTFTDKADGTVNVTIDFKPTVKTKGDGGTDAQRMAMAAVQLVTEHLAKGAA